MQTAVRVGDCVRKNEKNKRVVSFNKGIAGLIAFDDSTGVIGVTCLNKYECLETPVNSYAMIVNDNTEQEEIIANYVESLKKFRKFNRVETIKTSDSGKLVNLTNELKKPKSLGYLVVNANVDASAQQFLTKDKLLSIIATMDSTSRLFVLMSCNKGDGFIGENEIPNDKKCMVIIPNRKELEFHNKFGRFGTRFIEWQTKQFNSQKCTISKSMIQSAISEIGISAEKTDSTVSPLIIIGNESIMDCVFL